MGKISGVILVLITLLFFAYPTYAEDAVHSSQTIEKSASHDTHGEISGEEHNEHHAPHLDGRDLSLLWIIPFAGILLSIAVFPLVAPHFWHHHFGKVSLFWGLVFFIAFMIGHGANMSFFYLFEVYLGEFIPFIVLLLALFTVAGGIRLKGSLVGSPKLNTLMILIGTILASWMGTTGAAMLMIRPLIKANAWRKHKTHIIVFFIFLVANIGGSLTPLGDPPLFLGFLKGVSFFWTTTHMFLPMVFASVILLILFFIIDTMMMKKEDGIPPKADNNEKLAIEGKANFILLLGVIGAVVFSGMWHSHIDNPADVAITMWGAGMMTKGTLVQVIALLIITFVSLKITPESARKGNGFTWDPILEVAKLFATIFITMVPPIAMLKAGVEGPLGAVISSVKNETGEFVNGAFFWATGILSSFLDNAPTYVVFFNTALGENLSPADLMTKFSTTLLAISAGAVFMGANTYIGNAPNFMVKSIAEENNIKMPSFFGYMAWSVGILIPLFLVITFVFF
ncbi:MAG: sodium:proton antiporter [Candidatus Delongbacteria bacterium]|nr:sodium:proton antiporter [Candidatus Delongbacteria bacterium]MBN2833409.1 sodium:proton antiporter [Candidatus Delongbacteria bacterium]